MSPVHPAPRDLATTSSRGWAIEVRQLHRAFGATVALGGIDLAIERGEFFSLLGPSGCGKTTLLRIMAGLDQPDEGTLLIGGQNALPIPAHARPVNTVFQSYALFPHLNVFDNVGFGLRMKGATRVQIQEKVERMLELMQIGPLRERFPQQLSGGEKQRVALARAVVNEPEILLLDEPLGALDLKLRQQLQVELHRLQRQLGITFVYVTHDQDEALSLSDRIAVLHQGRLEQVGKSEEVYERPATRFVAQFVGGCNLLEATQLGHETNFGATFSTPFGNLAVASAIPEKNVFLAIRPEKILWHAPATAANRVQGTVENVVYNGAETRFTVRVGQVPLAVTVLNSSAAGPRAGGAGEVVWLALPAEALRILTR